MLKLDALNLMSSINHPLLGPEWNADTISFQQEILSQIDAYKASHKLEWDWSHLSPNDQISRYKTHMPLAYRDILCVKSKIARVALEHNPFSTR